MKSSEIGLQRAARSHLGGKVFFASVSREEAFSLRLAFAAKYGGIFVLLSNLLYRNKRGGIFRHFSSKPNPFAFEKFTINHAQPSARSSCVPRMHGTLSLSN